MRRCLMLIALLVVVLSPIPAHAVEGDASVLDSDVGTAESTAMEADTQPESEPGESVEMFFSEFSAEDRSSLPECRSLRGEYCSPNGSICHCWNSGYGEPGICLCSNNVWTGCN